jgi:membrane protein DedA with SNARE-associated domain
MGRAPIGGKEGIGVPFLHHLLPGVLAFFGTYTLLALLVLVLIEEAGVPIPIPGDALLVLAGALSLNRPPWFTLAALSGTYLVVLTGSSILYTLMRHGGRRFLARFGKYLRLGPTRLARVERWFGHHHRQALMIGRLIPGMRVPTTALAGLTGLPYRRYLAGAAVAVGIWTVFYFSLGIALRLEGPWLLGWGSHAVRALVQVVPVPLLVLLFVLAVLDALAGVILWRRHHAATGPAPDAESPDVTPRHPTRAA